MARTWQLGTPTRTARRKLDGRRRHVAAGGNDSGLVAENIARYEGRGVYASVTEIADAERISKSYVSRILRLALLAPDLVEAMLCGWADQRVMRQELERPLPLGWELQRANVCVGRAEQPARFPTRRA